MSLFKKSFLWVSLLLNLVFLFGSFAEKNVDESEGNIEYVESEIMNRKQDSASDMEPDEVRDYLLGYLMSGYTYKTAIRETILDELISSFPNASAGGWQITEKEDDMHVAEFLLYAPFEAYSDVDPICTGKFILKPDFSIEICEDTVELKPESDFCVYTTGETYAYHGCRMEECQGSFYDEDRDIYLEVKLPVFDAKEDEWINTNICIWEGLEEWFVNETDYRQGRVSMDYEIKTLDNKLFSILFYGEYEGDEEHENIMMGITISMASEKLLPQSVFVMNGDKDAYYNYYLEDEMLYVLASGEEGWQAEVNGRTQPVGYTMDKIEQNVYNKNGVWLGNCYYEVPYIMAYPKTGTQVAQMIRADMGSFVNEISAAFEEILLLRMGDIEYGSSEDGASWDGIEGICRCYVDTEITYNNENILELTYHYYINAWKILKEGEAVARYDLNEGTVLEHEDWQSGILEEMEAYIEEVKEENK